jgi:hypothetical protein
MPMALRFARPLLAVSPDSVGQSGVQDAAGFGGAGGGVAGGKCAVHSADGA